MGYQHHPNFPPSLAIAPNVGSVASPFEDSGEDAFSVEAQREAISKYGIAGRVWEAAYAMCAYVDPTEGEDDILDFDPPFQEDSHAPLGVIELGSGTGLVAARLARTIGRASSPGGFVIATDLPDVCPLLQRNLMTRTLGGENTSNSDVVYVRPLSWGDLDHVAAIVREVGLNDRQITHIVCSDLVYFPELLGPLLRTLIYLTSPHCTSSSVPPPKIVISYKIRSLSKETPFWSAFGLWFSFRPVLARHGGRPIDSKNALPNDESGHWEQFGAHEGADPTFVFVARRRPESTVWQVPDSDQELMEGVGARGTRTRKGDDTFEVMLFMAMGVDE